MVRNLVILLLVGAVLAACATPPAAAPIQPQAPGTPSAAADADLTGDPVAGSRIFLDQGCGACHRLAAAGATGTVGPDLDQSTRTLDEVEGLVARGKGPMPTYADRLTLQEIADVAAFIVAARGAGPASDAPAEAPIPVEVRTIDLSPLIEAWNDGDLEALQTLYAENALLASVDDVAAIQGGESLPTSIDEGGLQYQQAALGGMQLRILGEPIAVADKTAGFTFRLEGDDSGRDGVGLLRYEGGKIWLHIYALDPQLTPNPPAGTSRLEPASVDDLNAAWTAVDLPAVASLYQEAAKVWRDEDLVSLLTGSGAPLMSLEEQVRSRGPWGPATAGDPVRIGNLVLFPWRWEAHDYPNGYGVRLLQYEGSRIATDVRFALRPWEAQGGTFLEGY